MRSILTLGLLFVGAWSYSVAADGIVGSTVALTEVGSRTSPPWRVSAVNVSPRVGRLGYLSGSFCPEGRGCSMSTARPDSREAPREYIKSLSLGTYGPMRVKFTGDRVKLKVRF
ncbi:MAG: hypothetical protein MAG794_01706 [Gammaproteobacteria bacterium]|nr:hypothetical protein [Gammaproteobacteria bacterium]